MVLPVLARLEEFFRQSEVCTMTTSSSCARLRGVHTCSLTCSSLMVCQHGPATRALHDSQSHALLGGPRCPSPPPSLVQAFQKSCDAAWQQMTNAQTWGLFSSRVNVQATVAAAGVFFNNIQSGLAEFGE